MASRADPYVVLGVRADASDEEVRSAYRRLVQLHHPDHNHGSAESERRFEEVQEAYAQVRKLRASGAHAAAPPPPPPRAAADPDLDARLKDMERDLREAHLARERARRAAAEAAGIGGAQAALRRGARLHQDRRQLLEDLRRRGRLAVRAARRAV